MMAAECKGLKRLILLIFCILLLGLLLMAYAAIAQDVPVGESGDVVKPVAKPAEKPAKVVVADNNINKEVVNTAPAAKDTGNTQNSGSDPAAPAKPAVPKRVTPTFTGPDLFNSITTGPLSTGRGFSSLFYKKETLDAKRAEADRKLFNMFNGYLPGSKEYWLDIYCAANIPRDIAGTSFMNQGDRLRMVAHVEGERMEYASYYEGEDGTIVPVTKFIYKLNIMVANNDNKNESLEFNVFLDDVKLYNNTIKLEDDGESFIRAGKSMEVKISDWKYDKICVKFTARPLVTRNLASYEEIKELCNKIVNTTQGTPESYVPPYYLAEKGVSVGGGTIKSASSGDGRNQVSNQI